MGKKQANYRKGKLDAGWERVELLVPGEAVPWLKAYAKALKSAIELGLPLPGFQGMGHTAQVSAAPVINPPPAVPRVIPQQVADRPGPAVGAGAAPAPPGSATARAVAILEREEERRRAEAEAEKSRPDFSGGLIRRTRPQ
jgi:hypothetical protein